MKNLEIETNGFVDDPNADSYDKNGRYFPKYNNIIYSSTICPGVNEKRKTKYIRKSSRVLRNRVRHVK